MSSLYVFCDVQTYYVDNKVNFEFAAVFKQKDYYTYNPNDIVNIVEDIIVDIKANHGKITNPIKFAVKGYTKLNVLQQHWPAKYRLNLVDIDTTFHKFPKLSTLSRIFSKTSRCSYHYVKPHEKTTIDVFCALFIARNLQRYFTQVHKYSSRIDTYLTTVTNYIEHYRKRCLTFVCQCDYCYRNHHQVTRTSSKGWRSLEVGNVMPTFTSDESLTGTTTPHTKVHSIETSIYKLDNLEIDDKKLQRQLSDEEMCEEGTSACTTTSKRKRYDSDSETEWTYRHGRKDDDDDDTDNCYT